MTIADAKAVWDKEWPEMPVSTQTIRNWAKKYGFGQKSSFLPRSPWIINKKKFNSFVKDPAKFLNQEKGK